MQIPRVLITTKVIPHTVTQGDAKISGIARREIALKEEEEKNNVNQERVMKDDTTDISKTETRA